MLAAPRPALEGRQPPRLAMEDSKVPIRGLIALIALLALILLALLRLFTIPSVSHRDLSRLSRLSRLFCIFLLAPLQVTVPQGLKSLRENLPGPGLSPTSAPQLLLHRQQMLGAPFAPISCGGLWR
jgi:hypothetical protein